MLNADGTKTCSRCKLPHPTDNFYKVGRKSGADHFMAYCRPCTKAAAVEWQKANPDKMKLKWAEDSAELSERRRLGLLTPEEIERHRARGTRWRKNHPEEAKACQKRNKDRSKAMDLFRYRASNAVNANKHRAKKKGVPHDFSMFDWEKLQAEFNNTCVYCGAVPKMIDLDHIIPLHRGGYDVVGNIAPVCRVCNAHKHVQDPRDFARDMNVDLRAVMRRCQVRVSEFPLSDGKLLQDYCFGGTPPGTST